MISYKVKEMFTCAICGYLYPMDEYNEWNYCNECAKRMRRLYEEDM